MQTQLPKKILINKIDWKALSEVAWNARENAFIYGKTKVGSACMSSDNQVFAGCNVEHIFRSHDVHAEVNAITNMVASGNTKLLAILIVAEREYFTPCGACLDWIFQFGGPECKVGFQNKKENKIKLFRAKQLMPHYPY